MTISVKQNNTTSAATGVWVKVNGVWKQVATSGLEGVGGWATVTAVEAPTNHVTYTDSEGFEWKAWMWENPKVLGAGGPIAATRDLIGSITTGEQGLIQVLIVAGGGSGYGNAGGGGAGGVFATVIEAPAGQKDVYVGSGGQNQGSGGGSAVGLLGIGGGAYRESGNSGNGFSGYSGTTPGAGASGPAFFDYDPAYNTVRPGPGITVNWADGSTEVVYGFGGDYSYSAAQPPGFGWGGTVQPTTNTDTYNPGANGFVLVRVPSQYAASVRVTELSDEMRARQIKETEEQAARAALVEEIE